MEVIPVTLDSIFEVSSIRIMLPDDLTNAGNKMLVKETLIEIEKQFQEELPILSQKDL